MWKGNGDGDVEDRREPIAIVGVGLRFPGGNDSYDGFGEFLAEGRSGTGPIPEDRWDVAGLASDDPAGRGLVRTAGGGFLDDIGAFDARFFNMAPRRARYVDPQQRLVLECAWAALEHANIDPTTLRGGDAGVYVGVACFDYLIELAKLPGEELDAAIGTGTAHSAVAGRLSYFLGLHGPSISLDTACSSSLVALHLAAEALRGGECSIALCGGVSVIHQPFFHIVLSNAKMLAPDGRCKTFDQAADGYGRSEGCGIAVLKRLSDAERDGDRILGLVRGTAVRQDGASGGLTVPSGTAQAAVMRAALANAGLEPSDIQYVEAHGTGTPLGDPIEVAAIDTVLGSGAGRSGDAPLPIGSVKTNIGHMEAVAGFGGLVKVLLQLRDGEIYPHLNMTEPSSLIPWDEYPLQVPVARTAWPAPPGPGPRRALVNSFGFAGTLATAVVEQAPVPVTGAGLAASADGLQVLTVSARTDASLRALAGEYLRHVEARPDVDVAAFCRTTNIGRAAHELRFAAAVDSRAALLRVLEQAASAEPGTVSSALRGGQTAFVLAGSTGSLNEGLSAAVYRAFPVFRRHFDDCERLFAAESGISMAAALPALFAFEYALARLWLDWGVRPDALIGYGIGEVTAAAVAEALKLPDAVRLVVARARNVPAAISDFDSEEPVFTLISTAGPLGFAGGMTTLDERGPHVLIEIGPKGAVAPLAQKCLPVDRHRWVSGPDTAESEDEVLRGAAAEAFAAGVKLDWRRFHEGRPGRMVTVPGYRFERKRHWIPTPAVSADAVVDGSVREVAVSGVEVREFATVLDGSAAVPTAAFIELMLAAQYAVFGTTDRPLRRIEVRRPLLLDAGKTVEVRARLWVRTDAATEVEIVCLVGEASDRCLVTAEIADSGCDATSDALLEELEKLRHSDGAALATLRGNAIKAAGHLPPEILESAFQAAMAGSAGVVVGVESLHLLREPRGEALHSVSRLGTTAADLMLADQYGAVLVARGVVHEPEGNRP